MKRNRYADLLRVLAIGGVVYGHWLLVSVTYQNGQVIWTLGYGEPVELALNEGQSPLIVFPEGGRSITGEIGEFKSGLYYLGKKRPDLELVPVYIDNMNRVLPRGEVLPVPLPTSQKYYSCRRETPPAVRWRRGSRDI